MRALRWWDIPAAAALEPVLFGADAWSVEAFWSELAAPGRHYVATWQGTGSAAEMTGYAGLTATREEAWVQTVGVAPAYRRQGIATALLLELLSAARASGSPAVWLEVGAQNAGAQALYARHGFAAVGRRRGYYQATGEDALIMTAPL